ncbi:MAG: type II CAAX endopeptidase family protein [Myxococcota bacterium]
MRPHRVWLALFMLPLVLAVVFSTFGAYFTAVAGLQGDDVARAMDRVIAFPVSLGFSLAFLVTRAFARKDGLTLRDLGWARPSALDVVTGLGAGAVLWALNVYVLYPLVQRAQPAFDPTLANLSLPAAVVMMGISAASEDTLYRGYAFKLLRERQGTLLTLLVTSVFYAPLAGAQGWPLVTWAVYFGLVLGVLRIWRGNLWAVWLTHVVVALGPKVASQF